MSFDMLPLGAVLSLLGSLEAQELRLLTWGVVEGGFTYDEVRDLAEKALDAEGRGDPDELIDLMGRMGLLMDFTQQEHYLYRTRMAETVRLLATLRQWFPGKDWRLAPTLVADFRFQARPRLYPKRHLAPETFLAELGDMATPVQREALEALCDASDRGRLLLANFQAEATHAMLSDLKAGKSKGMIVCAGTGTGKTLSFYLPALATLAALVITEASAWTKGIAIYPRKELLKDQFAETYGELRRLDAMMARHGRRKITMGAFYGATPREANENSLRWADWKNRLHGYECPYLSCPECDDALYWPFEAVNRGEECLHCPACDLTIGEDVLVLTRDRMAKSPPDLLFTTTEMLNRVMSDSGYGKAFGLWAERTPRLMLLDEVHTYEGTTGAQVANLLRRYQHATGHPLHVTGLSATLENAGEFFATLVGLERSDVRAVDVGTDLEAEGMEYMIALRGDPVAGSSLLSTTIQTLMLLRRCLDPFGPEPRSGGMYPPRVFAFTDDLDVTNRLFHNLLDAEGRDAFGKPKRELPLAALRSQAESDPLERLQAGQSWHFPETLGHALDNRLEIGRTSSQDQGVSAEADIIVATAALEVGYNDPNVGAVVQHKAPRDMAAFLQRKGRAGRRRSARPWTAVVLSDYGRDRQAYQGYDQLFSPRLDARSLPISNRYVLKIQAVFATMDWIARTLQAQGRGSVWKDLSGPQNDSSLTARQKAAQQIVQEILDLPEMQEALENHLQASLRLTADEVSALMWEPPRALMTSALPTLLRRLESAWRVWDFDAGSWRPDPMRAKDPLPDFVPPNFFTDLLLPEVRIETPPQTRYDEERSEYLAVLQAMRTFAPGRVSRRYGIVHGRASHWIAPPSLDSGLQDLPLSHYLAEAIPLGSYLMREGDQVVAIPCFRPLTLSPTQIPPEIMDTSNAWLDWRSQIVTRDAGLALEVPQDSVWSRWLTDVRAYTHARHSPLEIRRFALGSDATIRRRLNQQVEEIETTLRFVHEGPVGVGFTQDVDGLRFTFRIPSLEELFGPHVTPRKLQALRTSRFRDLVLADERLEGLANPFQREWLQQIFLSVLTAEAMTAKVDLRTALERLKAAGLSERMTASLETLFQSLRVQEEDGDVIVRQRLHDTLAALCCETAVRDVLCEVATILWAEPTPEWRSWVGDRLRTTLGGALLEACRKLVPQMDAGDLVLDIDRGPTSLDDTKPSMEVADVWLTEVTLGGGGLVEELVRRYAADPAQFFRLVEASLEPGDFETVDVQLTRVLDGLQTDPEVAEAVTTVREAVSHADRVCAHQHLRETFTRAGIALTHPVTAALQARILRPGSSTALDALLHDLVLHWNREEARLGIEIDARVMAFIASRDPDVTLRLENAGWDAQDAVWRFQAISGLLWPRGSQVRARLLTARNPYAELPTPDRDLLVDLLHPHRHMVSVSDPTWKDRAVQWLAEGRRVRLGVPPDQAPLLREALLALTLQPVESGYLFAYPQVEGYDLAVDGPGVWLRLKEGRLV